MRLGSIFLFLGLVAAAPAMAGESFWSGYYVGADVGGDLAKYSRQEAVISPFYSAYVASPIAALSGTSDGDPSPAVTVRLGRSFLANDWLLYGVEIEGSYQRASATFDATHTFSLLFPTANVGFISNDTVVSEAVFDWTAALRARLGYLVAPNLLFYGGIGPTVTNVTFSAQHVGFGQIYFINTSCGPNLPHCGPVSFPTGGSSAASESRTVAGINLAGGLEYQLTANISFRAEYDYSRFSMVRVTLSQSIFQSVPDTFKVSPILQTASVGLAYHF